MKKFLLCLLLGVCLSLSVAVTAAQDKPREKIKDISSYIVYYGKGRVDDLAKFDLAIVQPDTLSDAELKQLHDKGTLVVAYLSIGEAEPNRPWFTDGRVDQKWLLGKNENWGSFFVDASQKGWQDLMVNLEGEYIKQGFDGVFLDTIDTVDLYPQTKQGMIDLIGKLRTTYPDALLVQNRGFTVIDTTASTIDALMFEDLITSYDFAKKEYIYADNSYTAEQMSALSKKTGLPILALDYAPPDNAAMAYLSREAAKKYGFISAVSVINLDDIPDYGVNAEPTEDIRVRSLDVESDGTTNTIVTQVENIGLKAAPHISLSLMVDGQQIATQKYDNVGIGAIQEWRVPWQNAGETANIKVIAFSVNDRKAGNNNMSLAYKATSVAVEPLLPLDQQKLRPADNGPEMVATALTKPLTIDGDLADWADMPCTEVNSNDQLSFGDASLWSGPDDLSGKVCYAWDNENIYVGMNITDDTVVQKYEGTNIWHGDHVELWFDTQLQLDFDSATASDDDFQLGISPGDFKAVKPSIFIWQPTVLDDVYPNIEYAVKKTDKGYSAELRIPATVLKGLRLATDHAIGATFDPSDTDKAEGEDQENMLSTAPHTQWGVPTLWNNLILKGTPSE